MFKYLLFLISIPAFAQTSSTDLKGRLNAINAKDSVELNVNQESTFKANNRYYFFNASKGGQTFNIFHRAFGITSGQNTHRVFEFTSNSPSGTDAIVVQGTYTCAANENSSTPRGQTGIFASTYNGQGWKHVQNEEFDFGNATAIGMTNSTSGVGTYDIRFTGSGSWVCVVEVYASTNITYKITDPF